MGAAEIEYFGAAEVENLRVSKRAKTEHLGAAQGQALSTEEQREGVWEGDSSDLLLPAWWWQKSARSLLFNSLLIPERLCLVPCKGGGGQGGRRWRI